MVFRPACKVVFPARHRCKRCGYFYRNRYSKRAAFSGYKKEAVPLLLNWMIASKPDEKLSVQECRKAAAEWLAAKRLCADEIGSLCDIPFLYNQRVGYCLENIAVLARHWEKSVFYQSDLAAAAQIYAKHGLKLPAPLPSDAEYINRMRDAMFRSRIAELCGKDERSVKKKAIKHSAYCAKLSYGRLNRLCRTMIYIRIKSSGEEVPYA